VFVLGIRYLNGFVTASEPDNFDRAEWPPHPGRIFMALAATHFCTGGEVTERQALLWLEALEKDGKPAAPIILACEAMRRTVVTQYVPVNDKPGPSKSLLQSAPLTRDRQARTFARAYLENDTVFLMWPEANPTNLLRSALAGLCEKVTRIGHSSSLVQMWVAEPPEIGEPNWIPDEDRAVIRLRLAPRGTLAYLESRYNAAAIEMYASLKAVEADNSGKKGQKAAKKRLKEEFPDEPFQLRPELSLYHGYAPPATSDEKLIAARTVLNPHLIVLRLEREDGPYGSLDLTCILAVAQRWREALLTQSNDLSAAVRSVLSGHNSNGTPLEGPHLAFVPLAFVDHEHADGHLLGVGLALPDPLSREDRRGVLTAVSRVRMLKLGRLGIWRAEPVIEMRPAWNLRQESWTAHPSGTTRWSTITPIVYDRHPKSDDQSSYQREVAAMIGQCCGRVGLPLPRDIIVTSVSAHIGVPPAFAFPRLHRKDGSARRHTHAIIVFDAPVCGPMILGAGRYRGYGVCRPIAADLRSRGGA
jgi:CRISPR-associated protein Csb2